MSSSSSNRFNRGGRQNFYPNPNPKFPPSLKPSSSSSSSPFPTTKTSKQNRPRNPRHKQSTQIWVKKQTLRNWLDLPRDVTILIFLKLGVIDVLFNAQSVCSSWRDIARDPVLYRRVDMSNPWNHFDFDPLNFDPLIKMALEAVRRSCGQLVELLLDCFGSASILRRVVKAGCRVRFLRLSACYNISDYEMAKFVKMMHSLEELELCLTSCSPVNTIKAAGQCCEGLRSFRLNHVGTKVPRAMVKDEEVNDEAWAIAESLSSVRRLHLFGNLMTNKGLGAILDKCPHLEYLDLRQCFNVDLRGDLLKKCQAIERLRLPFDSTEDYEFGTSINYMDSDEEFEPEYAYDDFTDPFNDLRLSDDDEGFGFLFGNSVDDGPSLVDLLFMEALMGDDYDDDDDDNDIDFGF